MWPLENWKLHTRLIFDFYWTALPSRWLCVHPRLQPLPMWGCLTVLRLQPTPLHELLPRSRSPPQTSPVRTPKDSSSAGCPQRTPILLPLLPTLVLSEWRSLHLPGQPTARKWSLICPSLLPFTPHFQSVSKSFTFASRRALESILSSSTGPDTTPDQAPFTSHLDCHCAILPNLPPLLVLPLNSPPKQLFQNPSSLHSSKTLHMPAPFWLCLSSRALPLCQPHRPLSTPSNTMLPVLLLLAGMLNFRFSSPANSDSFPEHPSHATSPYMSSGMISLLCGTDPRCTSTWRKTPSLLFLLGQRPAQSWHKYICIGLKLELKKVFQVNR